MNRFFRYISLISLFLATALNALAGKNDYWTLHPTLDGQTTKIIAGKRMVYFLAPAQPYSPGTPENSVPQHYLYRYDTNNKNTHTLTNHNILSETIVKDIVHNPQLGYVMAIYNSGNIDLLLENGQVVNIPGFMNATVPASKNINSVTFDYLNNRAYLATDFGFVEINDKKGEISDSRNYGRKLISFARFGDRYLAVDEDGVLYQAPTSSKIHTFDDFTPAGNFSGISGLYPLTEEVIIITRPHSEPDENNPEKLNDLTEISFLSIDEDGNFSCSVEGDYRMLEIEANAHGYLLNTPSNLILINRSLHTKTYGISSSDRGARVASWNMNSYWFAKEREGFYCKDFKNGSMTPVHTQFTPNSAAAFKCTAIEYHPSKGLLVSNHGNDFYFSSLYCRSQLLLSALKNNTWSKIGLPYTNPTAASICQNPNGMAIDPDYPQYVYFGSTLYGLTRINLDNSDDILHMTGPNDGSSRYYPAAIICEAQEAFSGLNRFSDPHFDASGNLWVMHNNLNSPQGKNNELWVWPRANSKATKDHTDVKPWLKIVPPTSQSSLVSVCLPLKHSANRNLVIVSLNSYQGEMVIVDHKGTLDNTSDDTFTTLPLKPVDQDGQTVNRIYVRSLYEDQSTGLVWVTTDSGVFTFNPRTAQQSPNVVNRIKVARNDGTSLADYLLNGVDVFNLTSDSQGRKWFSTNGAGLVCTSADGRTVIAEYTTDNSGIPSDEVYAAGWNPEKGSIMVSTANGLAELTPYGKGNGENLESARAYPNPVRPDYYGWVTIDGLVDNSLVKITDAEGNLVRELGNAAGGSVNWDVCDMSLKRVKSGVYYVLASSGPDSAAMAKVTKLLVIN